MNKPTAKELWEGRFYKGFLTKPIGKFPIKKLA